MSIPRGVPQDSAGTFRRLGSSAKVAYTGTSANVALPAGATDLRIVSTSDCFIKFGTSSSVAATNNDCYLPADTPLVVEVRDGDTHIAAIQETAGGTLHLTALN